MSSFKIILEVSRLLQATLWNGFASDTALTQHVPGADSIVLMNPAETARDDNRRLSLWLYQVQPNEFVRNAPLQRLAADDSVQYPPLAINLFYLLTPATNSVEGDQMVLGRSMQILNDNAILMLPSAEVPGETEELHIGMCQRDLREIAEVWEALQQPYRLSVCYEIRIARIDSTRTLPVGRVADRAAAFVALAGTA